MCQPFIPIVFGVRISIDCSETKMARGLIFVERAQEGCIHVKFIAVPAAIESAIVAIKIGFAGRVFPMKVIVCGTEGQSHRPSYE